MKLYASFEIDTEVLRKSMLINYPSKEDEIKHMNDEELVDFVIEKKLKQYGFKEEEPISNEEVKYDN